MNEPLNPVIADWIRRRVAAVQEVYDTYQCLMEHGVEIPDRFTAYQLSCPFHGEDHTPSSRYYPKSGRRPDYFHCFKCKLHLDAINLHARYKSIKFMSALQDLERRFRLHIPKKPEIADPGQFEDRGTGFVSRQWTDVPRVLMLLEEKLGRTRDWCQQQDFIKFCRVLDAVDFDYDRSGQSSNDMLAILFRLNAKMDDMMTLAKDWAAR